MEISTLTCFTNQWTDFYMIGTSVIKELIDSFNGMCNILACLSTLNLTLHDGGRYHIETNPLICRANQWTGSYMISAFVMKELREELELKHSH